MTMIRLYYYCAWHMRYRELDSIGRKEYTPRHPRHPRCRPNNPTLRAKRSGLVFWAGAVAYHCMYCFPLTTQERPG